MFRYRYVVAIMGLLTYINLFQVRMSLYLAMISMQNTTQFNWTETDQSTLMSSYFYGYSSLMIFSGSIIALLGQKTIVVGSSVLAGLGSLIFPWIIHCSFTAACVLQVAMGLSHTSLMPALQAILIPWAPQHESAKFFFVQGSGTMIGTISALYLGGPFINAFGWENLFIASGISSIIMGFTYQLLVEVNPESSKFVSKEEILYIQQHRLDTTIASKSKTNIPYIKILTSKPIWSVNIAFSTFSVMHVLFATLMPKYLTDQLDVDLTFAGQLTTIPQVVEFVTCLVTTFIADWLLTKNLSVKSVRRGLMIFAQFVPGVLCIIFTKVSGLTATMVFSTLILSMSGVQLSGAFLNINELCPAYAAAGMAVAGTLANVSGTALIQLCGPILNKWGNTQATWKTIFISMGAYNILG